MTSFFQNKTLTILPSGVQGVVYNVGLQAQTILPATYTFKAVTFARTLGMSGIGLLSTNPLLVVSICSTGALFFSGMGLVAGDTLAGQTFNSISWILNRPMAGVEMVVNRLVLSPLTSVTGLPLLLNATKELSNGKGISTTDALRIGRNMVRKLYYGWLTGLR